MDSINTEKIKAAVVGALSVDICPQFVTDEASHEDRNFGDIIKPGMITHIEGNEIHPGGPVANTGIAMSIFGIEPLLCAKIGEDEMGSMLKEIIKSHIIDGTDGRFDSVDLDNTILKTISESPYVHTAYSVILAPEGLDRAILQNPGANDEFSYDDLDWKAISKCKLLHFGHPSTMAKMYENDGEQLLAIFKKAKELGLMTSFDICAIDPGSDAAKADWNRILAQVLPYVDYFMPSIDDLKGIFDFESQKRNDIPGEYVSDFANPTKNLAASIALKCINLGAGTVIVKMGSEGMCYLKGKDEEFGFASPVHVEKEVSGLGAGDTSIAAFLSATLLGYSFEEAIKIACAEGALCVQHPSATGGLVPFEKIEF